MSSSIAPSRPASRWGFALAVFGILAGSVSFAEEGPPASPPADDAPAVRPPDAAAPVIDVEPLPVGPTPLAPPMIGGGIWLAMGPAPAIGGQVEGGTLVPPGEVSGAIHTVAAHPTNQNKLWIGAANGGIWTTSNALAASPDWTPLGDFESSLSIGALELDPTDATHMTLVAGIGRYSSYGTLGGMQTGLLKSTDGGATWTPLGAVTGFSPAGISGVAPRGMTIVASSNFSDAFTCPDVGIWRSTDGGTTFVKQDTVGGSGIPAGIAFDLAGDPASTGTLYTGITFAAVCSGGTNGIYKSTDTGATWTKVSSAAMDALIVSGPTNNIEIAADGSDVFVEIIQGGRPVGIFYSGDGGSTWTAMDLPRTPEGSPLPIGTVIPGTPVLIDTTPTPHGFPGLSEEVEIAGVVGPAINGVWTTSVVSPTVFSLNGSSDATPWTPATGTWQKVVGMNPKLKPDSQGGLHAAVRVDPNTGTTVYLGGDRQDSPFPNFLGALDFSGRLFRGDATVAATGAIPSPQWEHLTHSSGVTAIPGGGTGSTSAPHADSREIVFDAGGDLIEVDDGGIYARTLPTSNIGDWLSLNGDLQVTEIHDIAWDAISNVAISGNQDTGTTQQTSSSSIVWDSIHTGDGGDVQVEDVFVPGTSTRYSSFQDLGAFRRREYDASNTLLSEVFPTLTTMGSEALMPIFLTPVELNVLDPLRLVIGACNAIFESFDRGDSIMEVSGLIDSDCSPPVQAFPQNAIAYGGTSGGVPNPDVLYVGSGPLLYLRTTPGGTLTFVSAYPGTETIRDVVLDPADWMTAAVVESNLSGCSFPSCPPVFSKVFWTADAGITWHDITGNLTDPGLESAAYIPGSPDRLMVGGRDGVFELTLPPTLPGGPFTWGEIGTGLPNAPVWDLEYDAADDVLVAGTLGRGAWLLQENGTCGFPKNLVVRHENVTSPTTFKSCNTMEIGPSLISNSSDTEFITGLSFSFLNGVTLLGTVEVQLDPGLISP